MSVILLRHTRLVVAAGLCYGRTDLPLAESFGEELAAIRAELGGVPLGAVWSSPATRCQRLAVELAAEAGVQVGTESRLQELDFGAWENRPWESFRGPESEAWALDPWTLAPPAGESGAALWARVAAFRSELLAGLQAGTSVADGMGAAPVLVVTHAGVIRAWLGLERGLSWTESLALRVDYGAWVEVDGAPVCGVSHR